MMAPRFNFGSLQIVALAHCDLQRAEAFARCRDGVVDIYAAAGILDHHDGKSQSPCILGRITDTKIEGEANEKNARETAFAQVAGKPCRGPMVVLVESRI